MQTISKSTRILLIVLNLFLGLSAVAGGIQLLEGTYAPSVDLLAGSPFDSYIIPGLALGMIVGGSAFFAAVLLICKSRFALLASVAAGLIIMFFEFVEILVIGSPAGPAFALQVFYFGLGVVIATASLSQWFISLRFNLDLNSIAQ
jgi:hypothetical protein